jgi:hypothetical protein
MLKIPTYLLIVSGGMYAGNAFHQSVLRLIDETFPQVSAPPGNP